MSERKVLNKYYPPDFDPSKIPRMKLPKNRQYTVRLMAPFNMRCVTCGEYIYKGKKFNARKEDVEGQDYLGIRIYRFYIKCTRCLQEISFKTDPQNTDYEIEAGATRNFMALKLAEEQAQREEDERKEDEATNPMKLLENRTKQSKQELELLESLEELRDLNRRQRSVDYDSMLSQYDNKDYFKKLAEQQEEEDEKFVQSVFGSKKRVITEEIIEDSNVASSSSSIAGSTSYCGSVSKSSSLFTSGNAKKESSNVTVLPPSKVSTSSSAEPPCKILKTSINEELAGKLSDAPQPAISVSKSSWNLSIGSVNTKKSALAGLVRVKKPTSTAEPSMTPVQSTVCEKKLATCSNKEKPNSAPSGLSLLGSYSDSDSDEA